MQKSNLRHKFCKIVGLTMMQVKYSHGKERTNERMLTIGFLLILMVMRT